jgi:hypothetical protein
VSVYNVWRRKHCPIKWRACDQRHFPDARFFHRHSKPSLLSSQRKLQIQSVPVRNHLCAKCLFVLYCNQYPFCMFHECIFIITCDNSVLNWTNVFFHSPLWLHNQPVKLINILYNNVKSVRRCLYLKYLRSSL